MVNHPAIYSESAADSLLWVVAYPERPACAPALVGRMPSLPKSITEERGYFTVEGGPMSLAPAARRGTDGNAIRETYFHYAT
jgi:hypothetical protein